MPPVTRRPPVLAAALTVSLLLGVMWAEEIADRLLGGRLDALGIVPRTELGLRGLLFAPFLHVSFAHLLANSVPFAVLGFLVALRSLLRFAFVTLSVMLLGGLGVWLFAPALTVHLGASILVFGYLGYLLARGYFERSAGAILLALGVLLLYGTALWGVLPLTPGVSWQAHLFGFLAGVLSARWTARRDED